MPRALTVEDFLWGLFFGTMIVGPLIWTVTGRKVVSAVVTKAGKAVATKAERWAEKVKSSI